MRSPVKYFGGKVRMMNEIKSHFPKDVNDLVFIEGFGGSASAILSKEINGVELYNDLDENVYSLFKVISDETLIHELKAKLDLTPYSRKLRAEFINDLKCEQTLIERAYKFLYVNRSSFNGNGGFTSDLNVRRGMSKAVADYLSIIEYLPQIHQRFSRVIVENLDIMDLLNKYCSDNIFYYLDPPYVHSVRKSKSKTRYNCEMSDEDHKNMIELVMSHKAKFLISGYDNELYDKLEDGGWHKHSFKSPHSDSIETLWWNYELDPHVQIL